MIDVVTRLKEAAKYAAALEGVQVWMTFDADTVGYTMRPGRSILAGVGEVVNVTTLSDIGRKVTWEALEQTDISMLRYLLETDHRELLAHVRKQREDNVSPHEVHSDMCLAFLDLNNKCSCGAR